MRISGKLFEKWMQLNVTIFTYDIWMSHSEFQFNVTSDAQFDRMLYSFFYLTFQLITRNIAAKVRIVVTLFSNVCECNYEIEKQKPNQNAKNIALPQSIFKIPFPL